MDIDLREYLEERFGRVHDRFDAVEERIDTFDQRIMRSEDRLSIRVGAAEEKIESVNNRMWTVGALSGAAGTGIGFLLSWLETKLGLAGWIRKG